MIPDPSDTIVALSSADGPGARAIVRLSGDRSQAIASSLLAAAIPPEFESRTSMTGLISLPNVHSPLPAEAYLWKSPRTYTGQDLAEIHTISSPPLLELLIAQCLGLGARSAQPGEFTMRAFLAGKLDLTQAEGVLGVIEAGDRNELKQALAQLAGGASQPLHQLRDDLLNLLADVEAGLDFSDEDIQFVQQRQLLDRLTYALAHVTLVRKQIEQRGLAARPFRVVLAGKPNAGKSQLFNALLGHSAALVSDTAGTTRDYLEGMLYFAGLSIQLVDTAGVGYAAIAIEGAAQNASREQADIADLVLWCVEATSDFSSAYPIDLPTARILRVATKCDLAAAPPGWLATSALHGQGLTELRILLADKARTRRRPPLAPSLSRCRHHIDACLGQLRQAHAIVLHHDPAELLALELRGALDELGAIVGAVFTDDLLDRIFSRFCIGK